MKMNQVEKALHAKLGVKPFPDAPFGLDRFASERVKQEYREAFADVDHESMVVVAIGGSSESPHIVTEVRQLWEEQSVFEMSGVEMVLAIPKDLWKEIEGDIPFVSHLAPVLAPAEVE